MVRRRSRPSLVAALTVVALGVAATAVAALLAALRAPSAPSADATLTIRADCRIVDATRLEPLGDEADESVFSARARCTASAGPLRGASADAAFVWAFERGRLDRDTIRWRGDGGTLTTPAGTSPVRRDADGRWRTDLDGTIESADGSASGLAGRRYVLVARLDAAGVTLADADR
jgi:hypothetical protein